jgi:hypothetical protein
MTQTDPLIGPLTPTEWLSFFRLDDEISDTNPLPACCANVSEVRDAIFKVLRVGGDPAICWMYLTGVWHIVEQHLGLPITDPQVPAALRKLYETYVAPHADAVGNVDREEATARIMQQPADSLRTLMASIPEAWDVDTAEGRMRAVARLASGFLAYVYDQGERSQLARELAKAVGMAYEDVALVVDAMRCQHGLPWQPLEGARG